MAALKPILKASIFSDLSRHPRSTLLQILPVALIRKVSGKMKDIRNFGLVEVKNGITEKIYRQL